MKSPPTLEESTTDMNRSSAFRELHLIEFKGVLAGMFVMFTLGLCFCSGALPAASALAAKAREQIGVTTSYDSAYKKMVYPGGDVSPETGVCSDVVVRAFRKLGIDLQKNVHEDMEKAFADYPHKWGLKRPDSNIDHRRVPNLMMYFERQGWAVNSGNKATDFKSGDVVAWDLDGGVTHIGLVSDRHTSKATPLVIHNIGAGTKEEDVLFRFKVIGHYRPVFGTQSSDVR
jgi:uncharacterized protein YijF (DUF1287 family)